jgi:hypothetical protein
MIDGANLSVTHGIKKPPSTMKEEKSRCTQ